VLKDYSVYLRNNNTFLNNLIFSQTKNNKTPMRAMFATLVENSDYFKAFNDANGISLVFYCTDEQPPNTTPLDDERRQVFLEQAEDGTINLRTVIFSDSFKYQRLSYVVGLNEANEEKIFLITNP